MCNEVPLRSFGYFLICRALFGWFVGVGCGTHECAPQPLQHTTSKYSPNTTNSFTYDHRILRIAHPVCSAVLKQDTGGLVVRWVTTGEYPLLYVFAFFCSVV